MLQDEWSHQKITCKFILIRIYKYRIYKSFIRPHLDYGDIIYDKPHNESFKSKIENIKYKACIAITSAIQGKSQEQLYYELRLGIFRRSTMVLQT